jgi:serralysin
MKSIFTVLLFAVAATLILAQTSGAAIFKYRANITHDQEPGGVVPDEGSSGIGTFFLDDSALSLSYDIKLTGLDIDGNQTPGNANDNVTRTHFHTAAFGINGGIVFGQIDPSASLRNDLDDLVVDPIASTIKGVWDNAEGNGTTLAAQLVNFKTLDAQNRSLIYFNVHTADHGGGEIRGQLVLVPEPATVTLISLAALALGGLNRRRR